MIASDGKTLPNARARLKQILRERNQTPDRVAECDEEIRRLFEQRVAVLILDMCGFSRLTIRYGIIHYLAMVVQMEEAARPAVLNNGGRIIKQEADNLFVVFPTPAQALEAARDILSAFTAVNSVLPDERDIYGSIGIGYGDTLLIGDEDLFGSEVNLASKLGEDLAGCSEILLTAAAYEALPAGRYECAPVTFEVSGMELTAWRFESVSEPDQQAAREGNDEHRTPC